jgi:hypothetical protein
LKSDAHSPIAQKFILHWGEMGTRWGINRTVAQVHALLFLSPKPLPADEIADTLHIARMPAPVCASFSIGESFASFTSLAIGAIILNR